MMRWFVGVIAVASVAQPGRSTAGLAACVGDCDGGGAVSINELVTGVGIAQGLQPIDACAAFDADGGGNVSINELVAAVSSALNGCPYGPATPEAVIRRYAANLYANYSDALLGTEQLRDAVDAFVAAPTAAALAAAQSAWLAARPAYLTTEVARFSDGPIDNPDTGVEGFVNAWPLDEAYIDYVVGMPDAGIINRPDLYPEITKEALLDANEGQGETTISTGWHAIEFLLWGQDLDPNGPGHRPYTDYLTDGTGTAANQERRGTYLRVVTDLLVQQLTQVRDAWIPNQPGNYRAEFVAVDTDEALRRILTGMGTLSGGELTGERLSVAYDTKDQENEHSCFSDNTHVDHRNDELGIENAFFGRYGTVTGPGIYDLVHAVNAELADATRDAISAARAAILQIPVPFDQAILGPDSSPGRQAIAAAIAALNAQTDKIAQCAEALGVPISTTSP